MANKPEPEKIFATLTIEPEKWMTADQLELEDALDDAVGYFKDDLWTEIKKQRKIQGVDE